MDFLKDSDLRKELKSAPRAGYLLFGEEDYLKAFAIKQAKDLLCPDPTFAFFNEMRIDALDYTPQKLLDALMAMPMMAEKKLVVLNGLNFNTMRPNEVDSLCEVLEELKNYDYNLLLVNVAADCLDVGYLPKKPSASFAKLTEILTPVYFERCTTAKLAAWIQKHFMHNGVEAPPALCSQMAEYCGHSMFVLANEIDKLSYYLLSHQQKLATEEAMRLVCTPATEYDIFTFTNAIMTNQHEVALAILAEYRARRVDPLIILGDVSRVICDMIAVSAMTADGASAAEISSVLNLHSFRVGLYQKSLRQTNEKRLKRALEACTAADNALKGNARGYTPLEKLICTL